MSTLLKDFPVFNSENNFNAKKRSKSKNKEEELREKTFYHRPLPIKGKIDPLMVS